MNLKQLESILDDFDDFDEPNILFEQYVTPGYVAARMLHTISLDDHIKGKTIVDLGTGPGILAIGSALLGADYVVGVDLDENVFQIAKSNLEELDELFPGKPPIDFVHDDVTKCSLEKKSFDVAIFNPPFGTKGNSGIDIEFLKVALNLTRESVYSLHKSATRSLLATCERMNVNQIGFTLGGIFTMDSHTFLLYLLENAGLMLMFITNFNKSQ